MRIRSIKPELWTDALSGEWDARRTLFYVGLWQVADDAGRLRLDPRLIRAELDPFDAKFGGVEGISELLEEFVRLGRVLDYEAGGRRLGLVSRFAQHQVINKPTKSRLAPPPEGLRESSGTPTGALLPKDGVEGKGREGKGKEGSREQEEKPSLVAGGDSPSRERQVLSLWNDTASRSGLPKSRGSENVRAKIRTRMRGAGWLDAYRAALAFLEASPFHRGENDRQWTATLEWLLKPGKAEELADKADGPRRDRPAESQSLCVLNGSSSLG